MPDMDALIMVMQERIRQVSQEGYSPAHDDEHVEGQLALLAAVYALSNRVPYRGFSSALEPVLGVLKTYGWDFKPKDPIRDLVRAGALILAELERRLRAGGS